MTDPIAGLRKHLDMIPLWRDPSDTPEVERLMALLRARLNKNSNVDEGPLWNVVAAYLNATLVSVEGGFRGERDLREAMQVLAEYDTCRRRKKATKSRSAK